MRSLEFYKKLPSLAVVSYSAYAEYKSSLIDILKRDFNEVCIFPFETKSIETVQETHKKYYISIDELENLYGSLSRMSRIYAFESFLRESLEQKLSKGIVCTQDILVAKAVMNTIFAYPQVQYAFQQVRGFDKIYAVHFKK